MKDYYEAALEHLREAIKCVELAQEADKGPRVWRDMYERARAEAVALEVKLNDVEHLRAVLREKGYHVS